jgi:serine/threonine protein kinase/WD40 repeat protein
MIVERLCHPGADELRAFGQGRLGPEAALVVEQHVANCESCCRLLEESPADSFVDRVRDAEQVRQATTADAGGGTLADAATVPTELLNHPKYRVLGLVGQGGMGAVYRAEHRRMERTVALKVINPGLIRNPATVQRFQQEVRTAARLIHPNIVTAHDADEAGGLHFLVMEYVEGRSLAELVREGGPLPIAAACAYICQAAAGLQHAHEQGMVHRDIKPHNLMVTPGGQVKILDFGLARLARTPDDSTQVATSSYASLTGAGAIMGTADYIAPEQAADPRSADIRSDIYALGCTLFHLLTGRPPFPDGNLQDKLARHAAELLPVLTTAPPQLAAVVARMTAKEPAARYATPADVAEALAPFVADAKPRRPAWKRRSLISVTGLLLAVGLVLVGGIVLRVTTNRGDVIVQTDDKSLELTVRRGGEIVRIRDPQSGQIWDVDTKNYRIADAKEPDGLSIELPGKGTITLRTRDGKRVTVTTGPKGIATAQDVHTPTSEELAKQANALDALKPEDVPEAARAYVGGGDAKKAPPELVAVLGDVAFRCQGNASGIAYSPNGKILAVSGEGRREQEARLELLDAVTGRHLRTVFAPFFGTIDQIVFSSTSESVTVSSRNVNLNPLRFDVATGQKLPWVEGFPIQRGASAFSPDGKRAVVAGLGLNAGIKTYDAENGKLLPADPMSEDLKSASVSDLAFRPDGKALAYIDDSVGGKVYLYSSVTRKSRLLAQDGVNSIVFSPDGKYLAILKEWKQEGKIVLCDGDGKLLRTLSLANTDGVLSCCFAGETLVALSQDVNVPGTVLRLWDIRKEKLRSLPLISERIDALLCAFSPDGKTLAIAPSGDERRVRLFDTETGEPRLADPGHTAGVRSLAFSPDGKTLASAGEAVRFWNLATGKTERTWLTLGDGVPNWLGFSPGGKVLAGTDPTRGIVHFRELAGDRVWKSEEAHNGAITRLAFSPDRAIMATIAGDNTVRVSRVTDGKEVHLFAAAEPVRDVAFSPDGRLLAAGTYRTIKVWDLAKGGDRLQNWEVPETARINRITFRPDGRTLVALPLGFYEPWLIDWQKKEVLRRPPLAEGPATGAWETASFSPGGHLFALVPLQGENRLLLRQVGAEPKRERSFLLPSFEKPPVALAFSPDGRYVAVANPDGTIWILRVAELGQVPELPLVPSISKEGTAPRSR